MPEGLPTPEKTPEKERSPRTPGSSSKRLRMGANILTPNLKLCGPLVQETVSSNWYSMGTWDLGRKSGEPRKVWLVNSVSDTPPPIAGLLGMPGTKSPAVWGRAKGCCLPKEVSRTHPKRKSLSRVGAKMWVHPKTKLDPLRAWLPQAEVLVPSARPPKYPGICT